MLIGSQVPTKHVAQPYIASEGDNAIKVGAVLGIILDEWQQNVQRDWLAVDAARRYIHVRNGLPVPRQNGKTANVEVRIVYGTLFKGEKIIYTAHDYSTVTQLFDRMQVFYGKQANDPDAEYPDINVKVSAVRRASGKEAIFLKNGGAIYFSTRTKTARRGFTVDVVIFDESQELTDEQMKALMSTASASPLKNPQYIFLGTPPGPEAKGDVFHRVREGALSGNENDISWSEWSVDEVGDVSDEARWAETNPALGTRLDITVIKAELGTLDPVSFAQERLGFFLDKAGDPVIKEKDWQSLFTETPADRGKLAYGVKFTIDGSAVAVTSSVKSKAGLPHIELVHYETMAGGTSWLAEWFCDRKKEIALVAIDGKNGEAAALSEKMASMGFPKRAIRLTASSEVATAASFLLDAIKEGRITHIGQEQLDASALNAQKRPIRDGWGFDGIGGFDASPLEAASLAYWSVMTTKRNPQRKQRML